MDSALEQSAGLLLLTGSHMGYVTSQPPSVVLLWGVLHVSPRYKGYLIAPSPGYRLLSFESTPYTQ